MPDKPHLNARRIGQLVLVALIGGTVALFGVALVPPDRSNLGPATISARAGFGAGETVLVVPPLGTIVADTHTSPLDFQFTVAEIDPEPLADAAVLFSARRDLVATLEDRLRAAARRLALRIALGGIVIGGLAAAVLPLRTRETIVAGAVGGLIAVGVGLSATAATFDVEAFAEPRFTGALERAPQVIDAVNREFGSLGELRSSYERGAQRLTELLTLVADPVRSPRENGVAILHISDVHSNPLGIEIANQLARSFDVAAVLDTGDVTSFGDPVEARLGRLIDDIPVPYLFVPGNHDSPQNRRALASVDNVTLVDGEVVEVEGIRILGWADPTFTASSEISTEEGNEIRTEVGWEVAAVARSEVPDVLAVHDRRLAEASVGIVPLVVAGHTHERALEEIEGTLVAVAGSTGATGLGSFLVETDLDYEAQVLYFRGQDLVAIDYIRFDGLRGDFTIDRRSLSGSLEDVPAPAAEE